VLLLKLDPDAARKRHDKALKSRTVEHSEFANGTAMICGMYLPKDVAAAAWSNIDAIAHATNTAGYSYGRTLDEMRADIFGDLLTGTPSTTGPHGPTTRDRSTTTTNPHPTGTTTTHANPDNTTTSPNASPADSNRTATNNGDGTTTNVGANNSHATTPNPRPTANGRTATTGAKLDNSNGTTTNANPTSGNPHCHHQHCHQQR
jgi:hypothetical protein